MPPKTHEEQLINDHENKLEDLGKNMTVVLYALGEKSRTNGDRDKRIEFLSQKTEEEDKTLLEHITDIKISLESKADKKELTPQWLVKINTLVFTIFILALLYLIFIKQISPLIG